MANSILVSCLTKTDKQPDPPSSKESSKKTVSTLGLPNAPPPRRKVAIDFHKFVDKILQNSTLSQSQRLHIATYSWRNHTQEKVGVSVHRCQWYSEEKGFDSLDFSLQNLLGFLEHLHASGLSYHMVASAKHFLNTARTFSGKPLSPCKKFILDKNS